MCTGPGHEANRETRHHIAGKIPPARPSYQESQTKRKCRKLQLQESIARDAGDSSLSLLVAGGSVVEQLCFAAQGIEEPRPGTEIAGSIYDLVTERRVLELPLRVYREIEMAKSENRICERRREYQSKQELLQALP